MSNPLIDWEQNIIYLSEVNSVDQEILKKGKHVIKDLFRFSKAIYVKPKKRKKK